MINIIPHIPGPDRHVDDGLQRDHRDDHQDDGAQALGPRRPAEEHPPDDDADRRQHSREYRNQPERKREDLGLGCDGRDDIAPSTSTIAKATPGHSRSGLREVGSLVWVKVIGDSARPYSARWLALPGAANAVTSSAPTRPMPQAPVVGGPGHSRRRSTALDVGRLRLVPPPTEPRLPTECRFTRRFGDGRPANDQALCGLHQPFHLPQPVDNGFKLLKSGPQDWTRTKAAARSPSKVDVTS